MSAQTISASRLTRIAIDLAKHALVEAQREFEIAVREIVYESAVRDGAGPPSEGWTLDINTYAWTKREAPSDA